MPEAIIQTHELTRRFGGLTAVDHLNLEIQEGEIFGLVGPDGSGKTTTLRILCGLMDPTSGHARVAGLDVTRKAAAVKDSIGYMAQRFALYGDLTVEENIAFYADLFGVEGKQRTELIERLYAMTRMGAFRRRRAAQLSGGMKQKLNLMCALLHKPRILFLDEPTNGVDPVSRRDFWAILYQLVEEGVTVLVTTAYLDEAERCDRVGMMYQGRLIACDTPEGLRSTLEEPCYEVRGADLRRAREFLNGRPEVLSAEPAGAALHVFLYSAAFEPSLRAELNEFTATEFWWSPVRPSLEDAFIARAAKAALHQPEAQQ